MSTPIIALVKNEEGEKVIAQYVSTDTGNLSNANDDRSFLAVVYHSVKMNLLNETVNRFVIRRSQSETLNIFN